MFVPACAYQHTPGYTIQTQSASHLEAHVVAKDDDGEEREDDDDGHGVGGASSDKKQGSS